MKQNLCFKLTKSDEVSFNFSTCTSTHTQTLNWKINIRRWTEIQRKTKEFGTSFWEEGKKKQFPSDISFGELFFFAQKTITRFEFPWKPRKQRKVFGDRFSNFYSTFQAKKRKIGALKSFKVKKKWNVYFCCVEQTVCDEEKPKYLRALLFVHTSHYKGDVFILRRQFP